MQQLPIRHFQEARREAGFTLIELMISIAMVLLLVAGINAVFQAATKTTGTGMAVEEMTRAMRATERTFTRDFAHAVPLSEMPCLTIYSMQQYAFRNQQDMNSDLDGDPDTIDVNGNGKEGENNIPGEIVRTYDYNDRNHRIDRIGFFARDAVTPFERQTSDPLPVGSSKPVQLVYFDKSSEAWIWYGHQRLPDRAQNPVCNLAVPGQQKIHGKRGHYYEPGEGNIQDNRNNFFADDWCLGRMAVLLKIIPNDAKFARLRAKDNIDLSPLGQGSDDTSGRWAIEHSRFDIADTSIREFRDDFYDIDPIIMRRAFDYRFNCKPWAMRGDKGTKANPINMGDEMAYTVPFLQRGVSQFIVEFAGDFISQNPINGHTLGFRPDGEIDYVLIMDPAAPSDLKKATRQIRWYGMPRNADKRNDDPVTGRAVIPAYGDNAVRSADVIPLRDLILPSDTAGQNAVLDIEHFGYWDPKRKILEGTVPKIADYGKFGGDVRNIAYCAAWNGDCLDDPDLGKPSMIRIVMTLSDANGRLSEGQTVEYVFSLTR